MRFINQIVVHCADTPAYMDIGVAEIDQWHRARGWAGIGYHFVIRRDGTIETGRPVNKAGAHVSGHNSNTIGICLVGGKGKFNFTFNQIVTLRDLVATLRRKYDTIDSVVGHCELDDGKLCPQFDVKSLLS